MNGCIYRTRSDLCMKFTTEQSISFCVGKKCPDRKESNADRIRAMTDEELAKWYFVKFYPAVPYCRADECPADGQRGCIECLAEWLKQEVDND